MLLSAHELEKSFGATRALDGASFEVRAGERIALMGPSGSGKSTMLHCLAGITPPDAGEVLFDGRSLFRMSTHERAVTRRRRFGFVFQFGLLVPELSMADNVALPLLLEGRRRGARARATELLERLGVAHLADRLPGEVSGGEGQRVAIARAIALEPAVIFADEPTGALDSAAGESVMQTLIGAARDTGAAIVLVTHDATVATHAERRVEIRDGRITS